MPWPSLGDLLAGFNTRRSNVGRVLSLGWQRLRARSHQAVLEDGVATTPLARQLLGQGADSFAPFYRAFVDKRFGMHQRFVEYRHNLEAAEAVFGAPACAAFGEGRRVTLVRVGDHTIELGINDKCLQEGLWALSLRDAEGRVLSRLSFLLLSDERLLLGAVQGPKMHDQAALAGIRQATRVFHGMRPAYLLLDMVKLLAAQWRLQLIAVDPLHKARTRRWRSATASRLFFDYAAFWRENAGAPGRDGFWHLDRHVDWRDPEDAPARKRAMYKRRAEFMSALPALARAGLAGAAAEAAPVAAPVVALGSVDAAAPHDQAHAAKAGRQQRQAARLRDGADREVRRERLDCAALVLDPGRRVGRQVDVQAMAANG